MDRIRISGDHFVDGSGRMVLLRGFNLGGDCKVPSGNGGTNFPTDFSDHRDVSFVGRPFPLADADDHLGRIRGWGMNCLRLLTTWEAVEHKGPGQYDTAYLDYFAEVVRLAGKHGLYVFIDFHQDVWSRMTGGDGAPGWTLDAVGIDFTKLHAAGAAHVMQHNYDYGRGGRQEDRYPMMTWANNYRQPANAIMWTLFLAGDVFAPQLKIEGRSAQDFLQSHYIGAMREVAKRVAGMPNVLGFDTLNEPGTGWIGQSMSYRHVQKSAAHPEPVRPGPAWSPIDALLVARGMSRKIPQLAFDPSRMKVTQTGDKTVNAAGVSIWKAGVTCPFEAAGAYRLTGNKDNDVPREDYFMQSGGRAFDADHDAMTPFFNRIANEIRKVNNDWLVFAELDPFRGMTGEGFPPVPERTVNASHWYDIATLVTKTFMYPTAINPFNMKVLNGAGEIEDSYAAALGKIRDASRTIPGGAPTLIGEFGIPFDLDGSAAYRAWADGDRSPGPWEKHVIALDLMYNALDRHLLNSTQWNYTVSNRNDPACGDGWNQEDLSVYSVDQNGGRAVEGFVRPFVRATQGVLTSMRFDRGSKRFEIVFEADPSINRPTEIFLPAEHYPGDVQLEAPGLKIERVLSERVIRLTAPSAGTHSVQIKQAG